MATLEKVTEMQKRGMSDSEIASTLQKEGISPMEINNSLNQAKIKSAVSDYGGDTDSFPGRNSFESPSDNLAMPNNQEQFDSQDFQNEPQPQQMQQMQGMQPSQMPPADNNPYQQENNDYYYQQTPQAYSGQEYYAQGSTMDTEAVAEIAEQVVQEKFSEFTKKTGDLVSFKNSIQDKVDDLNERLKRIENTIDKLQSAIIGRIGEFGESTSLIHQDLENLHGTMSKMVNPLMDNYQELKRLAGKE